MNAGWLAGAAAAVALAACGGDAASGATADRARFVLHMDTADYHYLIWLGTISDGETVWLDAQGREQARAKGLVIALRDRLWRLQERAEGWYPSGCDPQGRPPRAPQPSVALEFVSGDESYRVTGWHNDGYGVEAGAQHATVTGQLGRFVFVSERAEVTLCDGAARTRTGGHTYDLVRDDAYDEFIAVEHEARDRRRAARTLTAAARQAGFTPDEVDDAAVVDSRLSWHDDAPALEHRFAIACTGCAATDSNTDTFAQWLPASGMPAVLAADAELPAPIRAALSATPGPVGVTWGSPNPRWQRVFGAK